MAFVSFSLGGHSRPVGVGWGRGVEGSNRQGAVFELVACPFCALFPTYGATLLAPHRRACIRRPRLEESGSGPDVCRTQGVSAGLFRDARGPAQTGFLN